MIGYHARPGRQLLLFGWLVGLPAVMVETIFLSIITTQPPLRLLTWPCPPPHPTFSQCIRWGLILRLFELGGIQSCSKTSQRFHMTCILSAKTMSWGELYRIAVPITAMDSRNDWLRSCAYVLCCQFANKAVSCKIWGPHRGGTEDLTASIFRVSWTTQNLETPRSPETSVTIYHLHIVLCQNDWSFNGILFHSLNKSDVIILFENCFYPRSPILLASTFHWNRHVLPNCFHPACSFSTRTFRETSLLSVT